MKKILYILTHILKEQEKQLISPPGGITKAVISIVLLRDAVGSQQLGTEHVYVLDEEVDAQELENSFPLISYRDMLELVFQSDTVIVV